MGAHIFDNEASEAVGDDYERSVCLMALKSDS